MAERGPFILIGDANGKRCDFLVQVLKEEFQATVLSAETYDGLVGKKKTRDKWDAILIAEDLPRSNLNHHPNLVATLNHLWMPSPDILLGCISGFPDDICGPPAIEFRVHHIYVPTGTLTPQVHDHLAQLFAKLLPRVPPLPVVNLADDPLLREQLRCLDEDRNLAKAEMLISRLTETFFRCDQVKVDRLTQGGSGAFVFRIDPSGAENPGCFVLKLCPRKFTWKLWAEAIRHRAAEQNFPFSHVRRNLPMLKTSRYPGDHGPTEISFFGDWAALCMDYVGGHNVIDMEAALTASREDLLEKALGTAFENELRNPDRLPSVRLKLLDGIFLHWLFKEWYGEGRLVTRDLSARKKLWDPSDAPAEEYITFPPYRFAGRTKGYILSFLDGREMLQGQRLFGDSWAMYHQVVREFVANERDVTGIKALDEETVVTLASVHGDLNANNIHLWLKYADQPFLIDFPFYQKLGHVVQDFTSLEVAIKFGLMDRQLNDLPDPQALDFTHSQVPLWLEMEEWLLSDRWGDEKKSWENAGASHNVQLSLTFVQKTRLRAHVLQQRIIGTVQPPDFACEYMPGLLYHTLRAIGYPNLSVFKRLLAVVSAGHIIQKMGSFSLIQSQPSGAQESEVS